jgi:hypothetical protein
MRKRGYGVISAGSGRPAEKESRLAVRSSSAQRWRCSVTGELGRRMCFSFSRIATDLAA